PVLALAVSIVTSTEQPARLEASNLIFAENCLNSPRLGAPICRPVKVTRLRVGSTVQVGASSAIEISLAMAMAETVSMDIPSNFRHRNKSTRITSLAQLTAELAREAYAAEHRPPGPHGGKSPLQYADRSEREAQPPSRHVLSSLSRPASDLPRMG